MNHEEIKGPSTREFIGGLIVILIVGGVVVGRSGGPAPALAQNDHSEAAATAVTVDVPRQRDARQDDTVANPSSE